MPFDIPSNWIWCNAKAILRIVVGATPSTSNHNYWSGDICWLPSGCCQDCEVTENYPKRKYITKLGYESCSTNMMAPNTVLIALTGATAGKVGLLKFDACANQSVVGASQYYGINPEFLFFQFMARRKEILSDCIGSAQPHISKDYIEKMYLAIPPLNEQSRIVSKINSFEPLILQYENVESKLSILESKFPEKLRKSILQYAIEGKLVKQDPNDEPASVLLERIRAEKERLIKEGKIKRDKNESYIYQGDDKNYYENLPQGWAVCTLGQLAIYKKGPFGSSLTKSMFVTESTLGKVKVYEQKNAIQHNEKIGNYFISRTKFNEMQSFAVNPLDFIVSCAGTIGEIYKLPIEAPNGIINQALMKVTLINEEISDYFEIVFYNSLHRLSKKSKGTAIKNIPPFEILKPAPVMIPPIDEQRRILQKLNEINRLIDCK